jgi:NADPH:quinone reductase-like Zn-dependent oxidoreductase
MRAAAIDRFAGPEVLSIHTLPVPKHNADEVLIAIDTAGSACGISGCGRKVKRNAFR